MIFTSHMIAWRPDMRIRWIFAATSTDFARILYYSTPQRKVQQKHEGSWSLTFSYMFYFLVAVQFSRWNQDPSGARRSGSGVQVAFTPRVCW